MSDAHVDASELVAALRGYARRAQHLEPALRVVAEGLVAGVNDNFETSGASGGASWPPLKTSTLKKRRGTTAQILKDTGRLAGSIRGGATDDYAEAASDVSYAVYHVSKQPRRVIPLRDFFRLTDAELYDEPTRVVLAFVAGAGAA